MSSAGELRAMIGLSGKSIPEAAKAGGIHVRTLRGWLAGEVRNPKPREVGGLATALHREYAAVHSAVVACWKARRESQQGEDDPVNADGYLRRQILLSGATAVATAGSALAAVLLSPSASSISVAPCLDEMRTTLAQCKNRYQACSHSEVAEGLRSLLPRVAAAEGMASGDERLRWSVVAAESYQLATSILLRFGSPGLALMAADRSLRAAEHSQVPSAAAASARVMTHALMRTGEALAAAEFAGAKAVSVDRQTTREVDGPEIWSTRGALLLRGAEAAAEGGHASRAATMLDEASELANRVGEGANYCGTAFTPTNVLAHRMAVELSLGNAGRALDIAKQIEPSLMGTVERQAGLWLDIAQAYSQWRKPEQALAALWDIERIAPQELRLRRRAKDIVRHVRFQAPPSIKLEVNRLADRIGITAGA